MVIIFWAIFAIQSKKTIWKKKHKKIYKYGLNSEKEFMKKK